jgi:UDP-N-acetylenolpyruvoylglucosamine reductase
MISFFLKKKMMFRYHVSILNKKKSTTWIVVSIEFNKLFSKKIYIKKKNKVGKCIVFYNKK